MAKVIHYWAGMAHPGRIVKGKRLPAEGRTQCGKWVTQPHGTDVLDQSKLPKGTHRGLNRKGNCSKCKAKVKDWDKA